jgi:hypothetical protein
MASYTTHSTADIPATWGGWTAVGPSAACTGAPDDRRTTCSETNIPVFKDPPVVWFSVFLFPPREKKLIVEHSSTKDAEAPLKRNSSGTFRTPAKATSRELFLLFLEGAWLVMCHAAGSDWLKHTWQWRGSAYTSLPCSTSSRRKEGSTGSRSTRENVMACSPSQEPLLGIQQIGTSTSIYSKRLCSYCRCVRQSSSRTNVLQQG